MAKYDFSATAIPVTMLMEASSPTLQQLGERLRTRAPPIVDVTDEITPSTKWQALGHGVFGVVYRTTWTPQTTTKDMVNKFPAVVKILTRVDRALTVVCGRPWG